MSTLVIGCGYLGQRVAELLNQSGEQVYGTVRSARRAAEITRLGIEPVIAEVLDPESLRGLPEVERVFYAVGFDRASGQAMRDVYVNGLKNVLDRLSSRTARLVYASSTGVFGQANAEWVDEASPALPAHESGKICLEAECRLRDWASALKAPATAIILRFAGLYGPGRVVRRPAVERGELIPGDPERFLNLIHIDDAARAADAALQAALADDLYLIADDRPVSRREYYSLIATLLGAPEPRFEAPIAGTPEQARDASDKRICNRRMRHGLGFELRYPDVSTGLPAALGCDRQAPMG